MAVGVGFEPTMARAITVFKTAAFVHSAIPPMFHSSYYLIVYIIRYLPYFVKLIFSYQFQAAASVKTFLGKETRAKRTVTGGHAYKEGSATYSGAIKLLRSIPAVHFASTGAACFEAAGVHGASVL